MYKRLLALSLLLSMEAMQASLLPSGEDAKRAAFFGTVCAFGAGLSTWAVNRWTRQPVVAAEGTATLELDGLGDDAPVTGRELRGLRIKGVRVEAADSDHEQRLSAVERVVGKPRGPERHTPTPATGIFAELEGIGAEVTNLFNDVGNPRRVVREGAKSVAGQLEKQERAAVQRDAKVTVLYNELELPTNGEAILDRPSMARRMQQVETTLGKTGESPTGMHAALQGMQTGFTELAEEVRHADTGLAKAHERVTMQSRAHIALADEVHHGDTGLPKVHERVGAQELAHRSLQAMIDHAENGLAAAHRKVVAKSTGEDEWRQAVADLQRDVAACSSSLANKVGTEAHSRLTARVHTVEQAVSGGSEKRRR